jgi:hypothetical protein
MEENQSQAEMTDKDLYEAYFKVSKEYYLLRLERFLNRDKYSFNIYAFLFALPWMMYRKLYKELGIFVLILIVIGVLEEICQFQQNFGPVYDLVINLGTGTAIGMLANNLYFKKAIKIVEKAKQNFESKEEQMAFLRKKGGISYLFLILLVIILGVCIFVFMVNNEMIEM